MKFRYFYIANFEQVALNKETLTGISSSTYVGQMQGESIKRIYSKHHRTFDGFSVIPWLYIVQTTKYYFKKQLHNMETKHCCKTRSNQYCCWDELRQGCRGSSHHWPFYHAVYCVINVRHQNIEVSISLKISFFSIEKLLLTWISRFLLKQPSRRL